MLIPQNIFWRKFNNWERKGNFNRSFFHPVKKSFKKWWNGCRQPHCLLQ